ncbi:hypothetical protein BJX70DRAFT_365905 [Aspergillus crustosus]
MPPTTSSPHRKHEPLESPSRHRTRSRSPTRRSHEHRKHRHREDSDRDLGRRHRHRHAHSDPRSHRRERERDHDSAAKPEPISLPLQARALTKRDLEIYEPMFSMYLDIQKGLVLEDLDADEVKGRWKSFVGKWNRGELAEGWYDPATLEKAQSAVAVAPPRNTERSKDAECERAREIVPSAVDEEDDEREDDGDDYGPMPQTEISSRGPAPGPAIPTIQDLELRRENAQEDALEDRYHEHQDHRAEIRSHKSSLRYMEDEVAPRAEPSTHERRMEKRREAAASNKTFADARRGGSPTDAVPDDELMGPGGDDLAAVKSAREKEQRRKNEREIRREEILRARAAEREERVRQYREKEEETIGWLKTLAKQRFG